MKKLLSILLIVTMLLAVVVAAVPASAAVADETLPITNWDKPWKSGSEQLNWKDRAINSVDEYLEIFNSNSSMHSGTESAAQRYYLMTDLDLRGVERPGLSPKNLILDGNGHTITLDSDYPNLFNNPENIEIRNVIFKGDIVVTDDTIANGGVLCQWNVKGKLKASNILILTNVMYARTVNTNQIACGLSANASAGSEISDVVFAGSIQVSGGAFVQGVSAIVGAAYGTTFTNCVNKGNLVMAGPVKVQDGDFGMGAIAGMAYDGCVFENCSNEAYMYYTGFKAYNNEKNEDGKEEPTTAKTDKTYGFVGGIVGRARGSGVTFTDCKNNNMIMVGDSGYTKHMGYAGGILGGIFDEQNTPLTMTGCENNGRIVGVYNGAWYLAGLAGIVQCNAAAVIDNCVNTGKITSYNSGHSDYDMAGMSGFIGYAYGNGRLNFDLTITNSVNNGDITSNELGSAYRECWGGFIGQGVAIAKLTVENCVNTGDIVAPRSKRAEFLEGAGGIVGGFRCVGANWAAIPSATYLFKNCYNLGNISGNNAGGIYGDNAEMNIGANGANVTDVEDITITIENCVNAGNITAKNKAGGIAGFVGKDGGATISVKNTANGGTVSCSSYAGGIFGYQTAQSEATFENCVNYGIVGDEDTNEAAGMIGNADALADFVSCINIGNVYGKSFAPFTNGIIGEAEGNKYFVNATVYSNFDGGEAVVDGAELVDAAAALALPYMASYNAIVTLVASNADLDQTKYLEGADWEGLKAACEAATVVFGAEDFDVATFTQAEADVLHKALLTALSTIVEKGDLTNLNRHIANAEAKLVDGTEYTDASLAKLNTALEAAKKVAELGDKASAADVAPAEEELAEALEKLKAKPVPVDYTQLETTIADVEALVEADYTAETWAALQTALASAKEALEANDQDDVDAARSALAKAKRTLESVVKPTEAPATDTQPADEGGCGSVVGGAAVVLAAVIALGAGVSFKKKED